MTADEEAYIFMYIDNVHNVTAYDVNIDVDLSSGLLIDYGSLDYISLLLGNPSSSDIISVSGQKFFTWKVGNLTGKSRHENGGTGVDPGILDRGFKFTKGGSIC